MLWVLKKSSLWDDSFEHSKHMLKLMHKKILTFLGKKKVYEKIFLASYNHATSNLAIYSHETSQDKLPEA